LALLHPSLDPLGGDDANAHEDIRDGANDPSGGNWEAHRDTASTTAIPAPDEHLSEGEKDDPRRLPLPFGLVAVEPRSTLRRLSIVTRP
jgi:hypothetical protein